jgi:hypothetical protein
MLGGIEVRWISEMRCKTQTFPNPICPTSGDEHEISLSMQLGEDIFEFANDLEFLGRPMFASSLTHPTRRYLLIR